MVPLSCCIGLTVQETRSAFGVVPSQVLFLWVMMAPPRSELEASREGPVAESLYLSPSESHAGCVSVSRATRVGSRQFQKQGGRRTCSQGEGCARWDGSSTCGADTQLGVESLAFKMRLVYECTRLYVYELAWQKVSFGEFGYLFH